jgi:anti-anti-sigma factor
MASGKVYHARHDGTCILHFQGDIDYTLSTTLDHFLDQLLAGGDFRSIVVDLNQTDSIDSTGLGLLAKIANGMRRSDGAKPLLFSSRPDINEILCSICLDDVFVLCPQALEADADPGTLLPAGEPSESELAHTVLAAHRLLCEMNDNNRALFQNVVDAIEKDLGPS